MFGLFHWFFCMISHCLSKICINIGQSVIISREGLILTLSILPCPQERIFWSTPCRQIDAERLSVLHQNSGGIGKSIPSALQISLDPRDFPRASPSGNLSGLGKSFGHRGWISQYLPRLGGARIQSAPWRLRSRHVQHWGRGYLCNSQLWHILPSNRFSILGSRTSISNICSCCV